MLHRTALVCVALTCAATAHAEVSANLGYMSEYIFRGVPQSDSAAMGGIDFEQSGFYIGTWAADVGLGAEVDVYLGYGGEIEGFSYAIGATGYYYTDDFDDTYQELNLSGGYGPATVDLAIGEYENFTGPTQDYRFLSVTVEHNGFYGVYGTFDEDFNGEYFELGYGTTLEGFDVSISAVHSDQNLALLGGGLDDNSVLFTISRSFTLTD